ncbi:YqgE/AlgH family protein [bacterium]|nr:YqgE/AlgH family protein [bacterium]
MDKFKNIREKKKTGRYLEGQLLIATPQLTGSCFEKSVIYICAHNDEGAMGIIINQPMEALKSKDVFSQLNIHLSKQANEVKVYFGGPVESARGFVLHSADYTLNDTLMLGDDMALTCTIEILKDIAAGRGPKDAMLALGYAGWGAGQLESELETNSWLVSPVTHELVFLTTDDEKWQTAAALGGVDIFKLSGDVGHA